MKGYYYYEVIRKLIIQFMDAFNDIEIKRLSPDGSCIEKLIHVPIKLSVKEKFWYWLQERKDDEVLPMITVWLTTIDFDAGRQVNSFFEMCKSTDPSKGTYETFLSPAPYNFTFTMNIWSLYLSDIDQILEQILPFFTPEIFIRLRIDELDIEFDVKVIFQSCTPEVSHDMSDEDYRVINYTLDFVAQAWLFKPATGGDDLIKCIYTKYSLTPEALAESLTTTTTTSAASGGITNILCGCYDEDGELIWKWEELGPEIKCYQEDNYPPSGGALFPPGCVEDPENGDNGDDGGVDGMCGETT